MKQQIVFMSTPLFHSLSQSWNPCQTECYGHLKHKTTTSCAYTSLSIPQSFSLNQPFPKNPAWTVLMSNRTPRPVEIDSTRSNWGCQFTRKYTVTSPMFLLLSSTHQFLYWSRAWVGIRVLHLIIGWFRLMFTKSWQLAWASRKHPSHLY